MKLFRQLEPGETAPENAIHFMDTTQEFIERVFLTPLPVSDDPDAGAKMIAKADYPRENWESLYGPYQNACRAAATAAVAATVPQLVAENKSLKEAVSYTGLYDYAVQRAKDLTTEANELRDRVLFLEQQAVYRGEESETICNELQQRIAELEQERNTFKDRAVDRACGEAKLLQEAAVLQQRIAELEATVKESLTVQPPRLIPATLELMQKHGTETVRYRSGEKPKRIVLIADLPEPIISIDEDGGQHSHHRNGQLFPRCDSELDLLMPEPAPRMKELWVGVNSAPFTGSDIYKTTNASSCRADIEEATAFQHIIRIEIPEEEVK